MARTLKQIHEHLSEDLYDDGQLSGCRMVYRTAEEIRNLELRMDALSESYRSSCHFRVE